RESKGVKRARAKKIIRELKKAYPDAKIALDFGNPLELLVATILAAQCTDERVNMVTPDLFKKYPTARHYARAAPETFEQEIRSTGFFRSKTRSIIGMARALVDTHGGEVPKSREALTSLPEWVSRPRTSFSATRSVSRPSRWTRTCSGSRSGWGWRAPRTRTRSTTS